MNNQLKIIGKDNNDKIDDLIGVFKTITPL
jgi:hypothetical protein